MPLIKGKSKKAFKENVKTEMHAGKPPKQALAIAYSTQRRAKKMADGGPVKSATEMGMESIRKAFGPKPSPKPKYAEGGEIKAASERPSADERKKRSMEMLDAHELEHESELDARDEHEDGIDSAKDHRELEMLDEHEYEHAAELDARDEDMHGIDLHDEREEDMLDAHPLSHKAEKRAGSSMANEDSEDEMEMDMLRMAKGGSVADKIRHRVKMAKGGEVDLQDSNGDEHLNEEDQLSFEAARKKTYFDDSQLDEQPLDSNEHGDELADADEHDMVSAIRRKMKRKML